MISEIVSGLQLICIDSVEIRIPGKFTKAGYFNDFNVAGKVINAENGKHSAIYFTLNKLHSGCIARAENRMKDGINTTSDVDIVQRRWLPIDLDAKRPSGISANNEEHQAALNKAAEIRELLWKEGFTDPIFADSGNGGHLLYRIEMENSKENTELIKSFLKALSEKASDSVVKVDETVFNAARIWKVYGTIAGKGDITKDRPHRTAKIIEVPLEIKTLKPAIIEAFIKKYSKAASKPIQKTEALNVESFCFDHGIAIENIKQSGDATTYVLKNCPFNDQHKDSAIIQNSSGKVAFKCFHDSCQGNQWKEFREMFDPEFIRKNKLPKKEIRQNEKTKYTKKNLSALEEIQDMDKELDLQEAGLLNTLALPWVKISEESRALRPGSVVLIAGQEKAGKTYFVMNMAIDFYFQKIPFKYLPLEDDKKAWLWRALAIKEKNYILTQDEKETVEQRRIALYSNSVFVQEIMSSVVENPRVGLTDQNGETVIPIIDQAQILKWLKSVVSDNRIVIVDPIAQIEFSGYKKFEAEASFVRQVVGLTAGKNCTVILCCHTSKGNVEAIQGAAELTRLTQTSIILERHEQKESEYLISGSKGTCKHNRTITIACARNGSGTGKKFAFDQRSDSPTFYEYGQIVNGKKKEGKR